MQLRGERLLGEDKGCIQISSGKAVLLQMQIKENCKNEENLLKILDTSVVSICLYDCKNSGLESVQSNDPFVNSTCLVF